MLTLATYINLTNASISNASLFPGLIGCLRMETQAANKAWKQKYF